MLEKIFGYVSATQICLIIVGLLIVYSQILKIKQNRKIAKLGGRAPLRSYYLPFGLDLALKSVRNALRHRLLESLCTSLDTYGNKNHPHTVEFNIAGQRIILTRDEANIKAILATQFSDYGKGEKFNNDWHDFLGNSIFATDGQLWQNSRQLFRPQFIKDRLSDIKIFDKHSHILIEKLAGTKSIPTVDVLDLFFRFTLDASTDFLLGRSVDSLRHDRIAFAEAFNEVQRLQSIKARMGDFAPFLLNQKKFHSCLKVVHQFLEPYIEDALNLNQDELEKISKSDENYTLLHAIALYTKDRIMIRDQLISVLLAGRDTTACTLAWLFYELSTRPDIVKTIREEIMEKVGHSKKPTYTELKSMKFLTQCLNETLRLYPIVPSNIRMALKDTTLPHGAGADGLQPVGIPKGTPIGYLTFALQRRPEIYPPVESGFPPIDEFHPERWYHWTPKSWTYIPFNGGPRICIGQQFAITEMQYTIIRIFQTYESIENHMDAPATLRADIVLQPGNPVSLKFNPVNNEKDTD